MRGGGGGGGGVGVSSRACAAGAGSVWRGVDRKIRGLAGAVGRLPKVKTMTMMD